MIIDPNNYQAEEKDMGPFLTKREIFWLVIWLSMMSVGIALLITGGLTWGHNPVPVQAACLSISKP